MIIFCAGIILSALPSDAAGKYCLAWWRERGYVENRGCEEGWSIMNVWVWDEQGNFKSNVQVRTSWGVLVGTTGYDGRCEIILDNNNQYYDLKCTDATGATSDLAPIMTGQRYPCWGHYSYEMGFMYKSDENNPGTFDTSTNCTVNLPGSTETDAPYLKSMAFSSINCADRMSDAYGLGNWQVGSSFHGQTFVATANTVAGVQLLGAIGGSSNMTYYCQILQGGPGGAAVSPVYTFNNVPPMSFYLPFPVNTCQVVPGQTYFLKVWRPEGMNIYQGLNNNYPNGVCYEGNTPIPGRELFGFIVCMDYTTLPSVHITSGPTASSITSTSATITWTTDVPSNSRVDYGLTNSYGQNVTDASYALSHAITLTGLLPGTPYHYKVTSARTSYNPAVSGDLTFTTTTDPRVLRNPGFEDGTGQTAWTRYGQFDSGGNSGIQSGNFFEIYPHSGTYFAGSAASWGTKNGGFYQRVTGFSAGQLWKFTAWVNTYNKGSLPSDTNNRVGIDPLGGTNPTASTIVWSQRASTQYAWQQIGTAAVTATSALTFFIEAQQLLGVEWNLNAFDDCAIGQVSSVSVPQALGTADGNEIGLVGKVATAGTSEIGGAFYLEEPNRSSGIRVATVIPVIRGDKLNVVGTLGQNADGERILNASIASKTASGQSVPEPIVLMQRSLGGEAFGAYAPGVWNGSGLYNIGLLVTCAGRITASGTGYFYLDDGSGVEDGSGNVGVRVDTTGLANPTGDYAIVTGISTLRTVAGHGVRTIRPRAQSDIASF